MCPVLSYLTSWQWRLELGGNGNLREGQIQQEHGYLGEVLKVGSSHRNQSDHPLLGMCKEQINPGGERANVFNPNTQKTETGEFL